MSHSRPFHTIMAFAAAACLAAASTYATVTDHIARACIYVRDTVAGFLEVAVAKFEQPVLRMVARPGELLQACAYALRLAKRDRPRVTPGWRMCPST
ncbi:hypothetical protein J2W32_004451 [Variovorax boronicumulans]|uniref:Uncharacterized protein n=1 Tax=Variovorax boronicumulans TaxID=436515 RepID=A0AAW8D5M5_9BURK|nr:hypothetical protein [Variovorax boronicumulans]MDP9895353.1 hypothetical protein [Variovorax boronicumulans]MDQ0055393.1 hypothetical protein [Variovorax boronicumulans]